MRLTSSRQRRNTGRFTTHDFDAFNKIRQRKVVQGLQHETTCIPYKSSSVKDYWRPVQREHFNGSTMGRKRSAVDAAAAAALAGATAGAAGV